MIEPGDAFPDFELANQDGETVRLADYRGRKIVLFAFPRADTPGCTRQACGFRDHFGGLQEAGAVVLGISPDPPAALARWKAKENLPTTSSPTPRTRPWSGWAPGARSRCTAASTKGSCAPTG
jgi:peroxiredoxin Q/BCP